MNITKIDLGYCHRCHRPHVVARILLPGWHHEYAICALCFTFLAKAITEATPAAIAAAQERAT